MATPAQPQYVQQPLVIQQPAQMIPVQQPQIIHKQNKAPSGTGLGIFLSLSGLASVIFGTVGIFKANYRGYSFHSHTYYTYYNPTSWYAGDIWGGLFYFICGILAAVTYKKQNDVHQMNTFYAFSIMSFILSLPHFGLSLGFMFNYGARYTEWFNIVSMIFALIGFSCSLTFIILLSKEIYCKPTPPGAYTVQFQGKSQVLTVQQYPNQQYPNQQYPNQPVIMQYQPAQPTYTQVAPVGGYTVAPTQTQTATIQPEPVKTASGDA
ncbi:uncharacterized protein TRIADDRAFT_61181 [Trichoplax adhaerens]|uniref:Uncharacterized protein n=1 Tax=Trichoplax adhaerens TaxID=10228 RepID=B3SA93_TRIAD|nr:predicted protein [Trichoplax adhaerens]EDV20474.1 predicted protein [Trichoplax adhaerens]|eukprot:XP_002117168.1 predicted protein [Trichoplax adhaerens]